MFSSQASTIALVVVALAFGYLYHVYRERYLALWALAWALWPLRYVYGIAVGGLWTGSVDLIVPALALARGFLLLAGTLELAGRSFSKVWVTVMVADLAWIAVGAIGFGSMRFWGLPHYWLLGAVLILAGVVFMRTKNIGGAERYVAGWGLILMGLHQADFPFLAPYEELRGWGVVAQNAFMSMAIFGILLTYFRHSQDQLNAAHEALEKALTTVIGAYVPICAHCKSIRDEDGAWSTVEHYLVEETGASLTHGYCPSCVKEHYPDLGTGRG